MTIQQRYTLKFAVSILLAAAGAVTIAIALLLVSQGQQDRQSGFIMGMGAGLLVGGIVIAIRIGYIRASQERMRKEEIKRTDERLLYIRKQAAFVTLIIAICAIYILSLALTIMGNDALSEILFKVIFGVLALYAVTYAILTRRH